MTPSDRPLRLLVATDGSDCASTAVELVAAIPWSPGSTVEVIGVAEPRAVLTGLPWLVAPAIDIDRTQAAVRDGARRTVMAARDRLRAAGLAAEARVEDGRASDLIASVAADVAADLIVVGSRGHGALETLLLGSTSAEVIDQARTPVLVARGRSLDRVILAWDGSDAARDAADLLKAWPLGRDARMTVVSVAESRRWLELSAGLPPTDLTAIREAVAGSVTASRAAAEAMAAELREAGLTARAEGREGDPAAEIVAVAREQEADLVVVGTHGRTGLSRLVMGSVARNVLHHAHCSVLVAKAPAGDTD